jgi:hypothetical protein
VAVEEPHATYFLTVGLPSRLGAGAWWHRSPPCFSIFHDVRELCVGWGCGGVEVFPLLGCFSFPMCLQHLRKIFTLRNIFYLLPSSSHHLGENLNHFILMKTFPKVSSEYRAKKLNVFLI